MTEGSIQHQNMKSTTNIKVFVRVRPFSEKEEPDRTCISSIVDRTIAIKDAKESHSFTFDRIFDDQSSQEEVYSTVGSEIINEAFKGLNGTIFCYGQTSSGKTHTIIGPDLNNRENSGILPRLVKETLEKIEQSPKNIEAKMKVSMVEIYNEKIKDLLDPSKNDLKIRSNKKEGIFLENLTEKYVLVEEEAFSCISQGISNRAVNSTNMNSQSSRSHLVFILNLHIHDFYSGQAKSSKIILVDLAGSEKISKTGAEGKVLEEAKKINASLTALGKVINILSEGKNSHVPYRDSKLTRLLQESLGGNSLTNLIVNVSPSSFNESETLTSIRFGQRAKSIKNEPIVNKSYTVEELLGLLKKAEETIQRQNSLITDLSKKKRTGGYGAIAVPRMITMHVIDDDNGSIEFEEASLEGEDFEDGQSTTNDMFCKSDGRLMSVHKEKTNNINLDFEFEDMNDDNVSIASRSALSHKRCFTMDQFPSISRLSKKQICWGDEEENKENRKEKENLESKNSIKFEENEKLGEKSHEKILRFSNIVTEIPDNAIVRESEKEKQNLKETFSTDFKEKTVKCEEMNELTVEENLIKIRRNLEKLKSLYIQEREENKIKRELLYENSEIIEKKNKIIECGRRTVIRETNFGQEKV